MQTTCTATVNSHWLSTGSVQTFTAPVSGVYKFELWGSPGGVSKKHIELDGENGKTLHKGYGGYTMFYVRLDRSKQCKDSTCPISEPHVLHVFVGAVGKEAQAGAGAIAEGGYNGGGYTVTCQAGAHSGSGGGMTHVSYTNNLAIATCTKTDNKYDFGGSWNPVGTIGVAGGGGGNGRSFKRTTGEDEGYAIDKRTQDPDGGGNETLSIFVVARDKATGTVPGSKNADSYSDDGTVLSGTETGYKRGVGQGACSGSGGGGGWVGGCSQLTPFSAKAQEYTSMALCGNAGAGGTGYICSAGLEITNLDKPVNAKGRTGEWVTQPNMDTTYWNYNEQESKSGGYARITLQK